MISLWEGFVLGLVQGITEWLPVSSSGHLVLFEGLFGLQPQVGFDIILHLASLLVVIFVFRQDILSLVRGVLRREKYFLKYFCWLIVASIPIALVGLFLNEYIKSTYSNFYLLGFSFLFNSILLFASRFPRKKTKLLSFTSTVFMGVGQAVALLPAVSRSATTISLGLFQGRKREDVARFSFLLLIPAILGASILEMSTLVSTFKDSTNAPAIIFGAVTTILVGFLSLRFLLRVIKEQKFSYFGWYNLILGIIVLVTAQL